MGKDKIVVVEADYYKEIEKPMNEKVQEMNKKGYELVGIKELYNVEIYKFLLHFKKGVE